MPKLRRIGPLVHALLTGVVVSSGALVTTTTLTGCTDENAPETHVKRLSDPMRRTASVGRLIQMFNDKMNIDKNDRSGQNVKPLLDTIVPPLAELASSGDLDSKTQGSLLEMLAQTRDPRALPALVKALEGYKIDDKRPDDFDSSMNEVVRNIGEMKAMEASGALLGVFKNLHASWPKAQNKTFFRTVRDAMMKLRDPKWEDELVKLIEAPIKTLDKKQAKANLDQMYWQTVSAELLGEFNSEKAVKPLIKVMLSPFKGGGLQLTAISALIKIGKPAIDAGVKLLTGEDQELMEYAESEFVRAEEDKGTKVDDKVKAAAKGAYVNHAVIIVANIGRAECVDPLLAALEKGDATTKAIIARELYKLPADPKVTDAFKKVWQSTSLTAAIPPGGNAKEALTEAASGFFDPELAVWVAEQALSLRGEEADVVPIVETAMPQVMKMGGPEQMALLDKLGAKEITYPQRTTVGKAFEKEIAATKKVVEECKEDPELYFKKLISPEASKGTGFDAIKAAYMLATRGGESARDKLIEAYPQVQNEAAAYAVTQAIDRLSPQGGKEVADKLQAIVDKAHESKDEARINRVSPLKTVLYRIRARSE